MKILPIILTIAFIITLALCTVYSVNYKQQQLPIVELTTAKEGLLNSVLYDNIIPLEAVHENFEDKEYVYLISEKDGSWGKEYFCSIRYVNIIDKEDERVALNTINELELPIAITSKSSILEGGEVKIKGGKYD